MTRSPRVIGAEQIADARQGGRQTLEVLPGDIVVHHAATLHGAGANRSPSRRRRAISVRYCGDGVRYQIRPGAPTKPHHSEVSSGDMVVDHPDCPLVWTRPPE